MNSIDFDLDGFKKFEESLQKIKDDKDSLLSLKKDCLKPLAAIYIRTAKLNTPVGPRSVKYKMGNEVKTKRFNSERTRQSWASGPLVVNNREAIIEVYNTSRYASFLNDGHRQKIGRFLPWIGAEVDGVKQGARLVKGWVDGQYMTEKAEDMVQRNARRVLNTAIRKWLEERGLMND